MSTDPVFPEERGPARSSAEGRPGLRDPIMSLSLSCDGATKVITASGEIDMSNAHLLVELVQFLCRPPLPPIALDLSTVTYLGAPGVAALLQVRELVTSAGGRLTLRKAPPFVLHVLGVTGGPPQPDLDIASARATVTAPPVVTRLPLANGHGGSRRPAPRGSFDGTVPADQPAPSG
ncbi:anti-anti-sigma factor [Micromonospora purpureochromogenes]|uniref:Anti-anti-sigma factor n=1 Tax=Micromonospora purpureochromogenes TaxID=47872 RepID=A0A1C4XS75_9ACTN|nr:anti-anti-sigma factor [Micromonospora purpureochromogenes]